MATSSRIVKPIVIDSDGVHGMMQAGAIIPVGGTTSSTFTVGGIPVLLADGSNGGGGGGGAGASTFQALYTSTIAQEDASITLSVGSPFSILDTTGTKGLVIAPNGTVNVQGDMVVTGTVNGISIQTLKTNVDTNTSAITQIQTQITGLLQSIQTLVQHDTTQSQQIIDIQAALTQLQTALSAVQTSVSTVTNRVTAVETDLAAHLAGDTGYRHTASAIDMSPITGLTATTVQAALEQLLVKISNISSGGGGNSNIVGYEFVQVAAAARWNIVHNLGSQRVNISVWDHMMKSVVPDSIEIIDSNTITVTFAAPQMGQAELLVFI